MEARVMSSFRSQLLRKQNLELYSEFLAYSFQICLKRHFPFILFLFINATHAIAGEDTE